MNLKQLMKEIEEICKACLECDPSCTGNLLKKSIVNMRFEKSSYVAESRNF